VLDQLTERKRNTENCQIRTTVQTARRGDRRATEDRKMGDEGAPGTEVWRKICGRHVSSRAGERWRRQQKTELDRDK